MVVVLGLYPIPRSPCANRKSFFFKGWGVCFRPRVPIFWPFPVPVSSRPRPRPRVHCTPSPLQYCAPLRSAYLRPVSVKQSVKQIKPCQWSTKKASVSARKNCIIWQQKIGQSVFEDTKRGCIIPAPMFKKCNFPPFLPPYESQVNTDKFKILEKK